MAEDWRDRALCREVGGELFFPEKGGDNGLAAKRVCARCPVWTDCREFGITSFQRYGVWGGLGAGQMVKIRKERGLVDPDEQEEAA